MVIKVGIRTIYQICFFIYFFLPFYIPFKLVENENFNLKIDFDIHNPTKYEINLESRRNGFRKTPRYDY